MFTTPITSLTDTEIAADIATCEAILKNGHVNGFYLDSDSEDYYRDWLTDLTEEQTIRAKTQDYETAVSVRRAA